MTIPNQLDDLGSLEIISSNYHPLSQPAAGLLGAGWEITAWGSRGLGHPHTPVRHAPGAFYPPKAAGRLRLASLFPSSQVSSSLHYLLLAHHRSSCHLIIDIVTIMALAGSDVHRRVKRHSLQRNTEEHRTLQQTNAEDVRVEA